MIGFSVTVDAGSVLAKLAALESLAGVEDALNDEADLLVADEQQYPAEVPGQRYVRTDHLKDMTYHHPAQRSGNTIFVDVASDAEYAGAVVGEDQAPAFAGRWRKFKKVATDRKPRIAAALQAAIIRSWGR
jgi:hypothetical protein